VDLFVHTQAKDEPEIVTVEETALVGSLVVEGSGDHIWVTEQVEEVRLDVTFAEAGIGHHHHIHRGHCELLHADVRYVTDQGRVERKTHDVRPTATIGRVLDWAVDDEGFNLPADQRPEYVLALPDAKEYLASDVRVITLVDQECTVHLDLLPKDHFGG
jgi:hypothetical protein